MKILAIRLQNLNSLRGAHELNLECGPLAEAGLFAITGPTGAGKSTILDAVTLALYGRAARYGSHSAEEMMSRGSGECMAAVEFACESGRYTAKWTLRRSRSKADGHFQAAKHELSQDGVIMEERTRGVVERVAALTGLDYDRFLRSVLLAQGQFAAFLTAKKDERADLLERITGSHIYSELGQLAHSIHAEMAGRIQADTIRLGAVTLLPDEERAAVSARLAEMAVELTACEKQHALLTARLAAAQQAAALRQQALALAQAETRQAQAERDFTAEEARLRRHAETQPFADAARAVMETERDLSREEKAKALAAEQWRAARAAAVDAAGMALASVAAGEAAAAAEGRAIADGQKKAAADIAAAQQWLHARVSDAALSALLSAPLADADRLHAEVRRLTALTEMLHRLGAVHTGLMAQESALLALAAEMAEGHARLSTQTAADTAARAHLDAAQREESLLHELVSKERVIRSLDDHRAHLQSGVPCPLCGSPEHPLAAPGAIPAGAEDRLRKHQIAVTLAGKSAAAAAAALAGTGKALAAAMAREQTTRQMLEASRLSLAAEWYRHFPDTSCTAESIAAAGSAAAAELERWRTLADKFAAALTLEHAAKASAQRVLTWTERRSAAEASIREAGLTAAPLSAPHAAWNEAAFAKAIRELHTAAHHAAATASTAATASLAACTAGEALRAALTDSDFADIHALRAARLDAATLQTLTVRRDAIREARVRLLAQRETLTAATEALRHEWSQLTTEEMPAAPTELSAALTEVSAQRKALHGEHGAQCQKLATDDALRSRYSAAAAALEQDKSAAAPWARLAGLIGSREGDKFSRFAQSVTLDHLIALANARLTQLCDRYRLLRSGPAADLQLQISDAWQADAARPLESLSGGETFLISLALALALSELAGRRTRIGTLFIDEGFGSLDSTALDIALSALESLRAGHSTIGIISHVEVLKARLTTRVEVSRAPGGWGRLEVTA